MRILNFRFVSAATFAIIFLIGGFFINPSRALALITTISASVNGNSTIIVSPGSSISIHMTVTINATSNLWHSTVYSLNSKPIIDTKCFDNPNHDGIGTYEENFTLTAPLLSGTYNVYLQPNSNNTCNGTGTSGNLYTLVNAVTIKIIIPTDLSGYNSVLSAVNETEYTPESWIIYKSVADANVVTTSNTQVQVNIATLKIADSQKKLILKNIQPEPITPSAPNVIADDIANTLSGIANGMEYKLDDSDYTPYNELTFQNMDLSGAHTLLVRVAAKSNNPFGPDTTLTFTTNQTSDPVVVTPPIINQEVIPKKQFRSSGSLVQPLIILNAIRPIPTSTKVLGVEKFNFTQFIKFKKDSYKVDTQGYEVKELQKFLNNAHYNSGEVDGKFGPITLSAVIKFQTANRLVGDGVVGILTRAILNE